MCGLLENLDVQRLVRHQLFEPAVLLLHLFELFGHQGGHPAVLRPPAVVRLLADVRLLANLGHRRPFAQVHVCLTQLGHDLLDAVSLLQKRDPYRPFGRQDPLTMAGSVSRGGITATQMTDFTNGERNQLILFDF